MEKSVGCSIIFPFVKCTTCRASYTPDSTASLKILCPSIFSPPIWYTSLEASHLPQRVGGGGGVGVSPGVLVNAIAEGVVLFRPIFMSVPSPFTCGSRNTHAFQLSVGIRGHTEMVVVPVKAAHSPSLSERALLVAVCLVKAQNTLPLGSDSV